MDVQATVVSLVVFLPFVKLAEYVEIIVVQGFGELFVGAAKPGDGLPVDAEMVDEGLVNNGEYLCDELGGEKLPIFLVIEESFHSPRFELAARLPQLLDLGEAVEVTRAQDVLQASALLVDKVSNELVDRVVSYMRS